MKLILFIVYSLFPCRDILKNLKRHKDKDLLKGQAVKNQKALWDKALEFRFLLQKAFSNSNRLPQEPVRSLFCDSHQVVSTAYSDLVDSSKRTLDSLAELQEVCVGYRIVMDLFKAGLMKVSDLDHTMLPMPKPPTKWKLLPKQKVKQNISRIPIFLMALLRFLSIVIYKGCDSSCWHQNKVCRRLLTDDKREACIS
nr:protein AATF-like isoform X3 [Malus domestica]